MTIGNNNLTELINTLQELLQPIQVIQENSNQFTQRWPYGFVLGNARGGTTLLSQWLASFNCFSYPSNFLTRFAYSVYVGAIIQEMIFNAKFDPQNDFFDINSDLNFNSELGKSKGALAVNEFNHFYRIYTKQVEPCFLNPQMISKVNWQALNVGIATIENVFDKPFISKMTMLKYNIYELFENINCVFFYIKRNPLFNMQSLYLSRIKHHNNVHTWYGSRPAEYDALIKKDIYHQIAGQIYFTDKSIQKNLKMIPNDRFVFIKYEQFCHNPSSYFEEISAMYTRFNVNITKPKSENQKFNPSNSYILPKDILDSLQAAYDFHVHKYGELDLK